MRHWILPAVAAHYDSALLFPNENQPDRYLILVAVHGQRGQTSLSHLSLQMSTCRWPKVIEVNGQLKKN